MDVTLSLMSDKQIERLVKERYNGSREVMNNLKAKRDVARSKLPEHVQKCLNRTFDENGKCRNRIELAAYDISNGNMPTTDSQRQLLSALVSQERYRR